MKKYKHYGVDVVYQLINKNFELALKENGIKFTELPILENKVLKYTKDGIIKYAVIVPVMLDEYCENVYITEQVPDDMNWKNLVDDINAQCHGREAERCTTKAKIICAKAEEIAINYAQKDENDIMKWMQYELTPIDFKLALASIGYCTEDLKDMEHDDVNNEYWEKMIINNL